jgi:drug/metabolite transporter (DMT)-like permease
MPEPLRTYGTASSWSDVPAGIRFSAIILVLLACALGLCGLFCFIALVILLAHHGRSLIGISLGLAGVVVLAASLVCLRAATALRNARLWAANVATVCGGLAVAFGGLAIFDFFHAGRQSADEYFLYPIVPIFLLLGAWLCIYLNMPRVRSSFQNRLPR